MLRKLILLTQCLNPLKYKSFKDTTYLLNLRKIICKLGLSRLFWREIPPKDSCLFGPFLFLFYFSYSRLFAVFSTFHFELLGENFLILYLYCWGLIHQNLSAKKLLVCLLNLEIVGSFWYNSNIFSYFIKQLSLVSFSHVFHYFSISFPTTCTYFSACLVFVYFLFPIVSVCLLFD